ncbi:hypothetical protein Tco_1220526 [Tanacetum coccineum]
MSKAKATSRFRLLQGQDALDASPGENVDDSTENDLALNVDHIFEADECDAFDSDVDEGPTSQTMFMANLTSEDPIYDEAGTSYDSNNPFEYVEDNEEHVVQCNASSVRNDALMSILDEMHEQGVQSRLTNKPDMVMNDSVTSELARYKELVGEYEKRAKFELTDRERKIDEQMRIIISDRNRKETSLKSELHSAQILLSSTVDHYKSKTEEVTLLKKNFKQKEDKFLEEFLDLKKLKDKIEDRLYKQDQSVQTVHMLCQPKSFYDEKHKVAIGYKNPVCLARAKQAPSLPLYNGHVLVTTNHTPTVIHDSEDTRELAEITRNRMLLKMQSPLCVENKAILKDSVERYREIEKEARVVKPLDSSLNYASDTAKISQEFHGMCVVNILKSVNATPTVRIVLNNEKQIWKPKGKLSDNSLNKTKQIWKQKGKLSDNSLYKTKRVWKATGKLFADIWLSMETHRKETHLRQFCDSDLEVAFRKHTCFVRDINGTDILKGSRSTNFPVNLEKQEVSPTGQKSANTNMEVSSYPSHGSVVSNEIHSIKGKKYILVIVDDYSRFTMVEKFLRSRMKLHSLSPTFLANTGCPHKTVRFHSAQIMERNSVNQGSLQRDKELRVILTNVDEHPEQSRVNEPLPSATKINAQMVPPVHHQEIAEEPTHEHPSNHDVLHPSHNLVTRDPDSAQSSSGNVNSAEPINNGGDEVGTDIGKGGGIPNDGASGLVGESMKGGGNGREWEVDAASALIRIIATR